MNTSENNTDQKNKHRHPIDSQGTYLTIAIIIEAICAIIFLYGLSNGPYKLMIGGLIASALAFLNVIRILIKMILILHEKY